MKAKGEGKNYHHSTILPGSEDDKLLKEVKSSKGRLETNLRCGQDQRDFYIKNPEYAEKMQEQEKKKVIKILSNDIQ